MIDFILFDKFSAQLFNAGVLLIDQFDERVLLWQAVRLCVLDVGSKIGLEFN